MNLADLTWCLATFLSPRSTSRTKESNSEEAFVLKSVILAHIKDVNCGFFSPFVFETNGAAGHRESILPPPEGERPAPLA